MDTLARSLLTGLSATALGFGGLKLLASAEASAQPMVTGYGPLLPDPARLLDLPRGFSYRIVSREGQPMSDGLITPGAFDGMACFPIRGSRHRVALVRNHEMWPNLTAGGAFGADHALARKIPRNKIFDFAANGAPKLGGTTTLVWDMRAQRLVRSHLSLAGTCGNCAGGATPWGSWLTCEETIEKAAPLVSRPHGFVFEVPSTAPGLVDPVPLTAMGRFVHEAAAVDPRTGIVYLTEDRPDSLFYRFLPNVRGQLARGGRLQALGLIHQRERDLRNWPADGTRFAGQGRRIAVGQFVAVRWIDMDEVESPDGDLKERGFAEGRAAVCPRRGDRGRSPARPLLDFYFSCTMGGPKRLGQVWRYRASPAEGTNGKRAIRQGSNCSSSPMIREAQECRQCRGRAVGRPDPVRGRARRSAAISARGHAAGHSSTRSPATAIPNSPEPASRPTADPVRQRAQSPLESRACAVGTVLHPTEAFDRSAYGHPGARAGHEKASGQGDDSRSAPQRQRRTRQRLRRIDIAPLRRMLVAIDGHVDWICGRRVPPDLPHMPLLRTSVKSPSTGLPSGNHDPPCTMRHILSQFPC